MNYTCCILCKYDLGIAFFSPIEGFVCPHCGMRQTEATTEMSRKEHSLRMLIEGNQDLTEEYIIALILKIIDKILPAIERGFVHSFLEPSSIFVNLIHEVTVRCRLPCWPFPGRVFVYEHPFAFCDPESHLFVAPETLMPIKGVTINERTDVYSLGVLIGFLLHRGFQGDIDRSLDARLLGIRNRSSEVNYWRSVVHHPK